MVASTGPLLGALPERQSTIRFAPLPEVQDTFMEVCPTAENDTLLACVVGSAAGMFNTKSVESRAVVPAFSRVQFAAL